MRRNEIIEGCISIRQALKECNIQELIQIIFKEGKGDRVTEQTMAAFLSSINKYSLAASKYNKAAKQLARILGINKLENPETWAKLTIISPESVTFMRRINYDIEFAISHLPKIIDMLQPDIYNIIKEQTATGEIKFEGKALLSVIILEEKNRISSPQRLKEVLDSIILLYDACSIIINEPSTDLCVIACDSGSDKSFDFLGLAKTIECIKQVILDLWDRVVFFREHQLSQRINLVAQALPIIDKIGELEKQEKIGPEMAEILRRKVSDGASKFLSSGAIIPDIETRSTFNPRVLMAPEPKLLAHPLETTPEAGDMVYENMEEKYTGKMELENLDVEEQKILKGLLEKAKKGGQDKKENEE
jgi:hypothetical protein